MTSSIAAPMHLTINRLMLLVFIAVCIKRTIDIAGETAHTNRLSEEFGTTAFLVSVRPAHRHYGSQATPVSLAWGA